MDDLAPELPRFLILCEDLNHTALHVVHAETADSALSIFCLEELTAPGETCSPSNIPDSRDGIVRLEAMEYPLLVSPNDRLVQEIFCSKDQLFTKYGDRTDQFLALRHFQLGTNYRTINRNADAAIQFRMGHKLAPEDCKYLVELGRALMAMSDDVGALREFKQCLKLADIPSDTLAYLHRDIGQIFRLRGDDELAISHFKIYVTEIFGPTDADIQDECAENLELRELIAFMGQKKLGEA